MEDEFWRQRCWPGSWLGVVGRNVGNPCWQRCDKNLTPHVHYQMTCPEQTRKTNWPFFACQISIHILSKMLSCERYLVIWRYIQLDANNYTRLKSRNCSSTELWEIFLRMFLTPLWLLFFRESVKIRVKAQFQQLQLITVNQDGCTKVLPMAKWKVPLPKRGC